MGQYSRGISPRRVQAWAQCVAGMDCECGHHLEAQNVEELFQETRRHVDEAHPDMQLTDEQLRSLLAEGA